MITGYGRSEKYSPGFKAVLTEEGAHLLLRASIERGRAVIAGEFPIGVEKFIITSVIDMPREGTVLDGNLSFFDEVESLLDWYGG